MYRVPSKKNAYTLLKTNQSRFNFPCFVTVQSSYNSTRKLHDLRLLTSLTWESRASEKKNVSYDVFFSYVHKFGYPAGRILRYAQREERGECRQKMLQRQKWRRKACKFGDGENGKSSEQRAGECIHEENWKRITNRFTHFNISWKHDPDSLTVWHYITMNQYMLCYTQAEERVSTTRYRKQTHLRIRTMSSVQLDVRL